MEEELLHEVSEVPVTPPEVAPQLSAWQELADVLRLSLPIIITMLSYTVMMFVDICMVGRHSTDELSAIGPASSCFFILLSLLMGTVSITNTFVAQSVGRGEKRSAPLYVWQGIYLSLCWGVLVLVFWPLAPKLFAWAGHAERLQPLEVSYFRLLLFRMPAVGVWCATAAFYQATKRSVVPMIAALIGGSFNVWGNYVLIFGKWGFPELGITGAALATVVASYLQAGLMLGVFLNRRTHREYGSRSAWPLDPSRMWRLLRVGLPAGFTWSMETVGWAVFLLIIVGKLGADALAAQNAAMQIVHFALMPVIGLNIGVQAIVGWHIGMKDYVGAKRRTYRAIGLAATFMGAMGVIFLLFRHPLIRLFCSQPEVVKIGGIILAFASVFQVVDAVAIISHGALKGAGDTRFPLIVGMICTWGVFIPLGWFLTQQAKMGIAGAWLSVVVLIVLLGIANFWRFVSEAWHRIDLFRHEEKPEPNDSAT